MALTSIDVMKPQKTSQGALSKRFGSHLAVRKVSHAYRRGEPPVLQDFDLEVQPGEIVALLGRSGCGKSTLLHLIAGLSHPLEGEVVINGRTVDRPSPKWVMMFQSPSLFPWLSVARNAALGLRFTRRDHDVASRIPEVLRLVEMTEFADRNAQDLSGGQQQRVALARSLATRPELLLLDEPFSALDAFTRRALQTDVRRIVKELGLTLVLVTHDVAEAARMADRAILLRANPGRIAGDHPLMLTEEDRATGNAAFQAEYGRLMSGYARIADPLEDIQQ